MGIGTNFATMATFSERSKELGPVDATGIPSRSNDLTGCKYGSARTCSSDRTRYLPGVSNNIHDCTGLVPVSQGTRSENCLGTEILPASDLVCTGVSACERITNRERITAIYQSRISKNSLNCWLDLPFCVDIYQKIPEHTISCGGAVATSTKWVARVEWRIQGEHVIFSLAREVTEGSCLFPAFRTVSVL